MRWLKASMPEPLVLANCKVSAFDFVDAEGDNGGSCSMMTLNVDDNCGDSRSRAMSLPDCANDFVQHHFSALADRQTYQ